MSSNIRRVRRVEGSIVVEVVGQVDLRHQPEFQAALLRLCRERPRLIILHLGDLEYMDSSGVGTLVKIAQTIKKTEGKLVLVSPSERVMSIFQITTLDRYFTFAQTEEEALAV